MHCERVCNLPESIGAPEQLDGGPRSRLGGHGIPDPSQDQRSFDRRDRKRRQPSGLGLAKTVADQCASDHGAPNPMIGSSKTGGNPAAFSAGDKVLPKPALDAARDKALREEPVLGKPGFAADRETQLKPDEHTGADPTLHYVSVFNPDVIPFKRMSAFDKVNDDQTLHVASTALVEVPVGGTTDPRTRDRFWGDVLVQLAPGRDVPLPSVAPDMRILSYEIKPRVQREALPPLFDLHANRSDTWHRAMADRCKRRPSEGRFDD